MINRLPRKLKKKLKKAGVDVRAYIDKKNKETAIDKSLDLIYENRESDLSVVVQEQINKKGKMGR